MKRAVVLNANDLQTCEEEMLIPSICGGKMNPHLVKKSCDGSLRIDGVENVSINQGIGIDLRQGVTAHDSDGNEIEFTVSPSEIDECDVGEHTVTYTAVGKDSNLMNPTVCGSNVLTTKDCSIGTVKKTRLVTIKQIASPNISGLTPITVNTGEEFDPLNGVSAVDGNGNAVTATARLVTYRTVLYADGTFIVNEASTDMEDNIAEHGEAVGVYEPYKTPNDYIFNGATQRPWHAFSQNVTRVEIGSPIKPVFMSYWFSYFANATSFDLTKLDTEDTVYMNYTFYRCSSVKELDLSNFETSKVANYNNMFGEDYSLEAIYASDSFVITGTPSSSNMFEQCNSIIGGSGTAYDANHIDAEYARFDNAPTTPGYFRNVNTTYRTVIYVDKTMIINESSEDTLNNIAKHGRAEYTYPPMSEANPYVFEDAQDRPWSGLAGYVEHVEFGSVVQPTSTAYWFFGSAALEDFDPTNLDTSNTTKMNYMFYNCAGFESFFLNIDTSKVTDMSNMFNSCIRLKTLDLSSFDTRSLTSMRNMFNACYVLETIYATDKFDVTNVNEEWVFVSNDHLVGGGGTAYASGYHSSEYARIDNPPTAKGYFTAK